MAEAAKRWKAVEDEVRKDRKATGEREKKSKESKEKKREKKAKKREKKAKKEHKRMESERMEKERRVEERKQAKLLKAYISGKDTRLLSKLPDAEVDGQFEAMLKEFGQPDEAKATLPPSLRRQPSFRIFREALVSGVIAGLAIVCRLGFAHCQCHKSERCLGTTKRRGLIVLPQPQHLPMHTK